MAIALKPETTHVVSYWHIPGGADYEHAEVHHKQATSEIEANEIADKTGRFPPEMAFVMTRAEYEECAKKTKGN